MGFDSYSARFGWLLHCPEDDRIDIAYAFATAYSVRFALILKLDNATEFITLFIVIAAV